MTDPLPPALSLPEGHAGDTVCDAGSGLRRRASPRDVPPQVNFSGPPRPGGTQASVGINASEPPGRAPCAGLEARGTLDAHRKTRHPAQRTAALSSLADTGNAKDAGECRGHRVTASSEAAGPSRGPRVGKRDGTQLSPAHRSSVCPRPSKAGTACCSSRVREVPGCQRPFLSSSSSTKAGPGSGPPPHLWEWVDPRPQSGPRSGKQTKFLQGKYTDISGHRQPCKKKRKKEIAEPLPSWAVPVGHGGWGSPRRPAGRPGPAPTPAPHTPEPASGL